MSLPIRQRGVYAGIPDAEYHGAQWALSSSGARYLLRAPALFVARMERPRTSKAFDLGPRIRVPSASGHSALRCRGTARGRNRRRRWL